MRVHSRGVNSLEDEKTMMLPPNRRYAAKLWLRRSSRNIAATAPQSWVAQRARSSGKFAVERWPYDYIVWGEQRY